MVYDLDCRYDARKSFYGKARVEVLEDNITKSYCLKSYDTLVAIYTEDKMSNLKQYDLIPYKTLAGREKTQTTTRHQKEFFKQYGLTDNEIKKLFKEGTLEV